MAKNNIEQEVRFFFKKSDLNLVHKLICDTGANFFGRYYERTIMYDNPNELNSFYSKKIDGRLRFRVSIYSPLDEQKKINITRYNSSKITWKRRLPKEKDSNIHKEEEIEVAVDYKDQKNLQHIFEKVLKCKRVSSYERYRSIYKTSQLSVTIDEFPYGIMLEVEIDAGKESDLVKFVNKLGLSLKETYPLSCDDKYVELCKNRNIPAKSNILFNDIDMPQIS